jgi:hypothetical protein
MRSANEASVPRRPSESMEPTMGMEQNALIATKRTRSERSARRVAGATGRGVGVL